MGEILMLVVVSSNHLASLLKTEAFRNRDWGDCKYLKICRIAH